MAAHLVCYAGIARPGHSYSMSSSYWVNTGTEPETLVFRADPPAAASWIKMAESSVTLDPGQAVSIPVTLTVPVGAAKGIYGARLEASGAEESVEFGVGVRPGCAGPAALPLVPGGGSGFPLPLWVVTGLLLAAALLTWLARQRRTDCDHPVHRLRGGKWQSLTLRCLPRRESPRWTAKSPRCVLLRPAIAISDLIRITGSYGFRAVHADCYDRRKYGGYPTASSTSSRRATSLGRTPPPTTLPSSPAGGLAATKPHREHPRVTEQPNGRKGRMS